MKKLIKQNGWLILLLFTSLFLIVACQSELATNENGDNDAAETNEANESQDNEATQDEELEAQTGGTLNIAINAPPPTLDMPASTAAAARDTSRLIFETLLTTDSQFNPKPMLAESVETDDNKTYIFHLRQGVIFHNGKEMIAEDVIASMERWMEKSTITGNIFNGATWRAEDDYTVVLELETASALALDTLATSKQGAAIMPKEIIESAPVEGVQDYVGTGPFKFVEWRQDQYIHFEKYDDYQPRTEDPDGLSGRREALVDEIFIHIVTDQSTRLTGLQTGEYDLAYGIPLDNYDQLLNDPNVETMLDPGANNLLGLNNVEGIASNFKIREAVSVALDTDAIMMAGYPNKDLYWLDSGYMDVNIKNWASTAGSEYYNQNDQEKAKQLLEEAGYAGEEFRIMATRDYGTLYNLAVVIHEQLKQIGMNATLEVYDWPTMLEKRDSDLSAWDAFVTASTTVSTPPQLLALSPTWAGGVNDDHVGEALKAIETAPTLEEAQAIWDDLQLYVWEELLPIVPLGGSNELFGYHQKVQGLRSNAGLIFWNVLINE